MLILWGINDSFYWLMLRCKSYSFQILFLFVFGQELRCEDFLWHANAIHSFTALVPNRGWWGLFPSPGVIWQCLETFLIATTGGWFYRLLLASRNERPRMLLFRQKTEAHRKESSRKISIVPRLRNPDFFIQQVRTACLLGALSTVNILTKFLPSQRLQFSGIYYKPNSFKLNIYQNKRTNKIQVIKTKILNLKEG